MCTHLLSDLKCSLTQRLRLLVLPSLPVQNSQVVEGGGDLTGHNIWVIYLQQLAEESADQNHSWIKQEVDLWHVQVAAPPAGQL